MNKKPKKVSTATAMAQVNFDPLARAEAPIRSVYRQSIGNAYMRQMGMKSPIIDAVQKAGYLGLKSPAASVLGTFEPGWFTPQSALNGGVSVAAGLIGEWSTGSIVARHLRSAFPAVSAVSPAVSFLSTFEPKWFTGSAGLNIGVLIAAKYFADTAQQQSKLADSISAEWLSRVKNLDPATDDLDEELEAFAAEVLEGELIEVGADLEADPMVQDLDGFLRFSVTSQDRKIIIATIAMVAYLCVRFADLWIAETVVGVVEIGIGAVAWSEAAQKKKRDMDREDLGE